MSAYYEDSAVTIYLGDCREVIPLLSPVDLVLTDPPYGIASVWKGGFSAAHGWGRAGQEAEVRNAWDAEAPDLSFLLGVGKHQVVWGGNYFSLPVSRGWLVWNKPERGFTLSEAELAWTNRDNVIRVMDFRRSDPGREHPTQKPVELMQWCLGHFPEAHVVLDPFMGSGTTLVAAKNLGRRAIGVEIEERWCEHAARRLAQGVLDLGAA